MDIDVAWDCELAKTPEGYYQVQGGLEYAIAKSLAAAPFADILWMETATANIHEAKEFADAIHAEFPDKMLAYNLSPSFNWDTTGMTDEQMKRFPEELGKLGFVFNFITYGGHQIDGLAAEEFATRAQTGRNAFAGAPAAQAASCWNRPTARLRPWSAAHVWMRRSWPPRDARPPPRPWARDRPSISIWSRPKFHPSCWRTG